MSQPKDPVCNDYDTEKNLEFDLEKTCKMPQEKNAKLNKVYCSDREVLLFIAIHFQTKSKKGGISLN